MKFTSAICVIVLAVSASAIAVATPEPEPHPFCQGGRRIGCPFNKRDAAPVAEPFCQGGRRIGCPFNKRAASAVADAFAEPAPFCQGGRRVGCPFNRRDAEAEAHCHSEDGPCTKAKRAATALADAISEANEDSETVHEALALRWAFPEPEAEAEPFCQGGRRIGCPFNKARDVDAETEVSEEVKRDAEAFCHSTGENCSKVKRAAEAAAAAVADAEAEAAPFCQRGRRVGCPFNKREADAIATAAAEALASL